jgi:hypothetical protein
MAKLSEIWGKYYTYTRNASDQVRSLCFAGLAVVWIFREPNGENSSAIPTLLIWCALLFIIALALDLLQNLVGAYRVRTFARAIELGKKGKHDAERDYQFSKRHPLPMECLWYGKVAVALGGWTLLLFYVGGAALSATLPSIGR